MLHDLIHNLEEHMGVELAINSYIHTFPIAGVEVMWPFPIVYQSEY